MNIQWIVLDVDGVLSDGSLVYTSSGEELKSFSVKDGLGLTALVNQGLNSQLLQLVFLLWLSVVLRSFTLIHSLWAMLIKQKH